MVAFLTEVEPDVCTYLDDNDQTLVIEIILPGVPRENICLKVNDYSLLISATGGVRYAKYVPFQRPVLAEQGRAVYDKDILRVRIPLRA